MSWYKLFPECVPHEIYFCEILSQVGRKIIDIVEDRKMHICLKNEEVVLSCF